MKTEAESEQTKIEDVLARLDVRLASLESRMAAGPALPPLSRRMPARTTREGSAGGAADGDVPTSGNGTGPGTGDTPVEGPTASTEADYWATAVQVGLALSQGSGLKGWPTAVGVLLPAAVQAVDNNNANKPVFKATVVPAVLGGAAYYIGRFATR